MMDWRPPGYRFTAKDLVKGLCGEGSDEAKLIMAAVYGKVEIFADSTAWNGFLWLVMNTFKSKVSHCIPGQNWVRSNKAFQSSGSSSCRT